MGTSPFMRFGMIARKLCSLVGGSKTPPTRPYATFKMTPFRRLSTLPYWDSAPVNHRMYVVLYLSASTLSILYIFTCLLFDNYNLILA